MKFIKVIHLIAFVLFITVNGFCQQAKHVIIITVDGFRPDFYLDTAWRANNIRNLMKDGAHAKGVNSVLPSMTYPSHTTIVTGVQPVEHGVYYNGMFQSNGSKDKIYWNDSSIKAPTLWQAAQEKGLKTAALFWPVSAGAPVLYNIPDIGSIGESVREEYSKPAGFINTVKKEVFNNADEVEYGEDENVGRIAAYIIKKDKPNLMAIHLFSVDHAQHVEGREGNMVKAAIASADSSVGIIVNALKEAGIWDNTVIMVTGDHGFVTVKTNVSPNVWMTNAGLMKDVKSNDWKAQFYSVGGSSYLYLKDKKDAETLSQVKEILKNLPEDQKRLFRIMSPKKLKAIGANPEVALVLSGENGASFNNLSTGEAVKAGKGGSHGYFPDFHDIQTGFVAYGPGIQKGSTIPVMNLQDIAPSIAKILGIHFPSAKGKTPTGLLIK